MCGRYVRKGSKQQISEAMRATLIEPGMPDVLAHYNIAPTTFQPVIRNARDGGVREMLLMRWGLVPFFAKSLADFKGFSTFNAKAESVSKAATWREPFNKGRRCLIPADGFYEWKVIDPEAKQAEKQPYVLTVGGGSTFAFAGLWDAWHNKADGSYLQSFTILTTAPNALTGKVHDRMPVILHLDDYDEWLLRDGPAPAHLLKSFPAEEMAMWPVSKDVGNVKNNSAELLNSR